MRGPPFGGSQGRLALECLATPAQGGHLPEADNP